MLPGCLHPAPIILSYCMFFVRDPMMWAAGFSSGLFQAFSRILYILNSGAQYIWTERKSNSGPIVFEEIFRFFFPSCKWLTDSCLPAVDHPFWETGTNTPKGPCCLFSASGKASSSRSRCFYTCEDLLSCCAVNLHTSKTVSMQPLRPRVQRDSSQLLLMGSSHSASLRLS